MASPARCSLAVAALLLVGACSTVDVGAPPADVNACRPSQRFFVEQVWPNYLTKDYGGKTCADANCHGAATSSALKLPTPTSTPEYPLLSGSDWFAAYLSASQEMSCTDVTGSPLYAKPSGLLAAHSGGTLFPPGGPEFDLLQQWVTPGP
ncbi:MAG TPA: hypothetical protein VGP07_18920 [Polyangia bacterium]|jgi:hypothetical protein